MTKDYLHMPRTVVQVDAQAAQGPFDPSRFSIGHGAVNHLPLPDRVVQGAARLKPRLMRVFLQEYFDVYPDHGVYNWSKLDAYLDSFARTGAKVLATINLRPRVLFPELNQDIWRPNDVDEYQDLIYRLVRRYSVEKPLVTHWEHANEGDYGWWGGCPFRFGSPEESHEFYQMLVKSVRAAFPDAKVGGPCPAMVGQVPAFVGLCARHGTPLDFVSFHGYTSDLDFYRRTASELAAVLDAFPGKRPELMLDEWNQDFPPLFVSDKNAADLPPYSRDAYDLLSVEEMAMQGRRAAATARIMLTLLETRLDRSFYFLLWDSCMFNAEFSSFYPPELARDVMYQHWNEKPHRFGLFSESGKARPQYFVFQILSRIGGERLATSTSLPDLKALAARQSGRLALLLINHSPETSQDRIVKLHFSHLKPGIRHLAAYRVDDDHQWSDETLELRPIDERRVDVLSDFEYQFFSPADSVLYVTLDEAPL